MRAARKGGVGNKKNLPKKVFGNNSTRELVFLSNPQPFTAAVTHKSYFNHSMQKAASAYEAREKICGKASCMACSRAEITAQLQARGPRGRETLPVQAKEQDDRDPPREKARKNI